MNLKKRFAYAGMAAALALSLTVPTFAANVPAGKGGNTIIGVIETNVNATNLSVEIPLYLTLAVVQPAGGGAPTLAAPSKGTYYIKNTSDSGNSDATEYDIGVTAVFVDTIQNGTWKLDTYSATGTDKGAGTTDKDGANSKIMTLNFTGSMKDAAGTETAIGANNTFALPTLHDAGNSAWLNSTGSFTDAGGANLFATAQDTFRPIAAGESMILDIDGGVNSSYTVNVGANGTNAVAQFRVTYLVSALDKTSHKAIGAPYAGDLWGAAPHGAQYATEADAGKSYFDPNNWTYVGP